MTNWTRRSLDRAELRALELEKLLLAEVQKYGRPSFWLVDSLITVYVARARERKKRGSMTDEDRRILERYDRPDPNPQS